MAIDLLLSFQNSFFVLLFSYFILISLISLIVFSLDKSKAKRNKRRIPEKVLHILELLGGVFVIIPWMYVIRHKNRKFKYFIWSYLILVLWLVLFFLLLTTSFLNY